MILCTCFKSANNSSKTIVETRLPKLLILKQQYFTDLKKYFWSCRHNSGTSVWYCTYSALFCSTDRTQNLLFLLEGFPIIFFLKCLRLLRVHEDSLTNQLVTRIKENWARNSECLSIFSNFLIRREKITCRWLDKAWLQFVYEVSSIQSVCYRPHDSIICEPGFRYCRI